MSDSIPHGHGHGHTHGPVDPDLAESRAGVRVLLISFIVLGVTALAQVVVVLLTGSVALLADTVHNVGDALTAVPLAIAFVLARRPPSRRFPSGLGRTEDLAGLAIVGLIAFSGGFALWQSVDRLRHPHKPEYLAAGIAAGVVGFVGNELVALYRIRQGRRMASAALIADGMHARVDGFTSLGVAAGLVAVALGFEQGDPIVGLIISAVIMRIAWQAARDIGVRLLDGIEPADAGAIEESVARQLPAGAVREVRSRWLGHVIHTDVTVNRHVLATAGLDPDDLADRLQSALRADGTRARTLAVVLGRAGGGQA